MMNENWTDRLSEYLDGEMGRGTIVGNPEGIATIARQYGGTAVP